MSLKIWLPLNNSLVNQGIESGVQFTGTSSNAVGKITSSCLENTSNTTGGYVSNKIVDLGTKQSMFCWVYFNSFYATASLTGVLGQHRYSSYQGMGITAKCVSSTTGYLSVNTGNGSSRTFNTYCGSTLLSANKWYHVGYTYDGTYVKLYVNGNLDGTFNLTDIKIVPDYIILFAWSLNGTSGNTVQANYKLNGRLNDVRLYDHCLSLKEVKQLARGLMVHYPLSRPGDNLLRNTITEKSWSGASTYKDSNYTQDTITPAADSYYTMSFMAKSNVDTTGKFFTFLYNNNTGRQCDSVKGYIDGELVYTGSAADGSCPLPTYTEWHSYVIIRHFNSNSTALTKSNVFRLQANSDGITMYIRYAKIELGPRATHWIPHKNDSIYSKFPFYKGNLVASKSSQTIGSSSSTGQYVYATINPTAGGNYKAQTHRVRFNVTVNAGTVTQVTVLFYNLSSGTGNTRVDATIVNGMVDIFITPTAAVPNLLIYAGVAGSTANKGITISNLVVYDSFNIEDNSGYGNNATSVNITSIDMNTARYLSCPVFNGSSGHIYLPKGTGRPKDTITVSVWAYMLDWSTFNARLLSCTQSGGWNFEPSGTKIAFAMGTGVSSNTYQTVGSTTTLTQLNTGWHHFVGTYDGLNTKIYIDGELDNTKSAYTTATPIFYTDNYTFIGAEAGGDTTTPAGNYFNGKISDVRIYATALSATDVKELYESAASIDKNGNMHCYELIES